MGANCCGFWKRSSEEIKNFERVDSGEIPLTFENLKLIKQGGTYKAYHLTEGRTQHWEISIMYKPQNYYISVAFYLKAVFSNTLSHDDILEIYIKDKKGQKRRRFESDRITFKKGDKFEIQDFFKLDFEELNRKGYFNDTTIVIYFNIIETIDSKVYNQSKVYFPHPLALENSKWAQIRELATGPGGRENSRTTCCLKTGEFLFYIQTVIACAGSRVLREAFLITAKNPNFNKIIDLSEHDREAISRLIYYLYYGQCIEYKGADFDLYYLVLDLQVMPLVDYLEMQIFEVEGLAKYYFTDFPTVDIRKLKEYSVKHERDILRTQLALMQELENAGEDKIKLALRKKPRAKHNRKASKERSKTKSKSKSRSKSKSTSKG